MVVMGFAAAALTGIWHERRGAPPNRTVQAPHWPSPQPYLVPIRPSSSRSAVRSGVSGSQWTVCRLPLISSSIGFAIIRPSSCGIPQASPSATSYHRGMSRKNRRNRRTRLRSVITQLRSSESTRNGFFAGERASPHPVFHQPRFDTYSYERSIPLDVREELILNLEQIGETRVLFSID